MKSTILVQTLDTYVHINLDHVYKIFYQSANRLCCRIILKTSHCAKNFRKSQGLSISDQNWASNHGTFGATPRS